MTRTCCSRRRPRRKKFASEPLRRIDGCHDLRPAATPAGRAVGPRNARARGLRRRPTISESTRPIGLYPSLHSERSEAIRGSAAARPLIWRRLVRRRRKSSRPFLHDRLWKCVGGPLVDRGMASLARTGSARGNGNARSSSPSPCRVISFWASPKSELIPLLSRINSAVNPLLIRCYGGRVSPVRAEFIAGSRRGERSFAAISLPRGFCSRRGGRRSAMPSQFENPMMIFLFENNKVCHDYFSHSERVRMLIRAIGKAAGTKPAGAGDALGRSAAMRPDCPLSSEQGLENAQNDKG